MPVDIVDCFLSPSEEMGRGSPLAVAGHVAGSRAVLWMQIGVMNEESWAGIARNAGIAVCAETTASRSSTAAGRLANHALTCGIVRLRHLRTLMAGALFSLARGCRAIRLTHRFGLCWRRPVLARSVASVGPLLPPGVPGRAGPEQAGRRAANTGIRTPGAGDRLRRPRFHMVRDEQVSLPANRRADLCLKAPTRLLYHEYTVRAAGRAQSATRRIVCSGDQRATEPCYCSDDHYAVVQAHRPLTRTCNAVNSTEGLPVKT